MEPEKLAIKITELIRDSKDMGGLEWSDKINAILDDPEAVEAALLLQKPFLADRIMLYQKLIKEIPPDCSPLEAFDYPDTIDIIIEINRLFTSE